MTKSRYTLFIENIAQDALFLLFFILLLSVYRAAFLLVFQNTLEPSTSAHDILLTMWYGFRISLKTAGAATVVPFILCTLVQTAWPKWPAAKIRLAWGGFWCLVFALLFQSRIPYYKEFQNAFSPFLFNTFHDDVGAIVQTAITQYNAVWRVLLGVLLGAVSGGILVWLLKKSHILATPLLRIQKKVWVIVGFCAFIAPFAVFMRFGGSFNYTHSIYWKNAARMSQHLLNEAILDDVQALYRARRIYRDLAAHSRKINPDEVRQAAERFLGKPLEGDSLLPVFTRKSQGAKIEKPTHIFVVVAETYMLWPLLDNYKELPIANGLRALIAQPNAILLDRFLSASDGTMFGLTSVLLGLPDVNLFTANRPTAQEPYETALSVQLKKLGYKTRFFYGGYPSWNGLGVFIKNQGFDESFYSADLGGESGVWGMEDKRMLQTVEEHTTDEPTFTYILTVTNHPPYTVDMTQEPQISSPEKLRPFIPEGADEKAMLEKLQHFEYADYYLAKFVREMQQKYPDSLFVITGDHADRWTMQTNPPLYERLAVPLVIIGKGISKEMLAPHTAGAHMDIVPTVMELILPKGATYYALGKDVLGKAGTQAQSGLHAYYYITPDVLGEAATEKHELLPNAKEPSAEELNNLRSALKDTQTLTAWRVLKGMELTK